MDIKKYVKSAGSKRKRESVMNHHQIEQEIEMEVICESAQEEESSAPPPSLTHSSWNDQSEELLRSWSSQFAKLSKSHRRKQTIFKLIHVALLVTTMILSYAFGSSGLAINFSSSKGDSDNSTAATFEVVQSYILVVVGILSTLLKLGKFEKRTAKHKTYKDSYNAFARKINVQLVLPRDRRPSFVPFVEKIEREHKKLIKQQINI